MVVVTICQCHDLRPDVTVKKSKALLKFKRTVEVEVRLPEFEPLASLKSLDYRRLEKGNHTVEIGFLSGGCCRKLVRAVVKNEQLSQR